MKNLHFPKFTHYNLEETFVVHFSVFKFIWRSTAINSAKTYYLTEVYFLSTYVLQLLRLVLWESETYIVAESGFVNYGQWRVGGSFYSVI